MKGQMTISPELKVLHRRHSFVHDEHPAAPMLLGDTEEPGPSSERCISGLAQKRAALSGLS
jgi:hypothetical protein